MRISDRTLEILKNFSDINDSILIREGNSIATISTSNAVFATATVVENFPKEFGIYDLNEFLGVLSLMDQPTLDFDNDDYVLISSQEGSKVKYVVCDPVIIDAPPSGKIDFGTELFSFTLESQPLKNLLKSARILSLEDFCVEGDGTHINAMVKNKNNPTSNVFKVPVGETTEKFTYYCKCEHLHLISTSYQVTISDKEYARFVADSGNLNYFIGLEPNE